MDDERALRALNQDITDAENDGNRELLASILAPRLAFQRGDDARTVDDAVAFLQKVQPGGRRKVDSVGPIDVFGNRAIVHSSVSVDGQVFHNLRVFVRRDDSWKLLAWANEPT